MSVFVKIIGEENDSDEYEAAYRLKKIIEKSVSDKAIGEIILYPSVTLFGQAVKDVDIMMFGNLKNYSEKVYFSHSDGEFSEDVVYLENFCTTIEVKSHSATGIRKVGTDLEVLYGNSRWHNATKQSNAQKYSAKNFFENNLGESPYITNLLWFVEISDEELERLLTFDGRVMQSNALPAFFDFREIVQILADQRNPWYSNSKKAYFINCSTGGNDAETLVNTLKRFSKIKEGMGELTRRKIEMITNTELSGRQLDFNCDALNIFRGRAGTGKTIDLIKAAIKLVDENDARVQILTFNRALVSDIRRLFTLAELPDIFEEKCVSVNTMQSYFYELIKSCLYDDKELSGEEFLNKYSDLLQEIIDFIKSDPEAKSYFRQICETNPKLNWDYILIDEAQDWSDQERNLILLLYDYDNILVADGGQQFVRSISPCDWTVVPNRKNIRLKYCLRQKRNLVKFVNLFSSEIDPSSNKIIPLEKIVGGKVLVISHQEKFFETVKKEKTELKKAGNEPYDFLFIVPYTLVDHSEGNHFKYSDEFDKNHISLWDGTNNENRSEFPVDLDQSRVLQYESSRGLEGWTVCCINFDEFMDIKEERYVPKEEGNPLLLESPEDRYRKYILNWATIPFTRAIDTLIISLKDTESKYSKILLKLANEHPDYIQVV
jgi:hypothetical protein